MKKATKVKVETETKEDKKGREETRKMYNDLIKESPEFRAEIIRLMRKWG